MTDSSISSYTCMGTRMVVITSKEGESSNHPREGLLVVYQKMADEEQNSRRESCPAIRIRLGTDQSIYRCDIPQSQVKLSKEEKKRLPEILLQDKASSSNSQSAPIQLSFQFNSDGELKIFLKQKVASASVSKNAFRGVLQKEGTVSLLRFCADLGEAINSGMSNVTRLQDELNTTRSSLQQWKETANKLDMGSTREKTLMLKGAYQAWIQNQARQKKALDDLTKQLKENGRSSSSGSSRPPPIAAPDDWSALKTETIMPESMIEALAEGRKVYKDNERKPILNKDTAYSGLNKDKKDYAQERRAKRRGKAKRTASSSDDEKEDVKVKHESDSEEENPRSSSRTKKVTNKRRRKSPESPLPDNSKTKASSRKKMTAMDLDSDDDDSAKKPPPKPIETASKTKGDDDSSETDDGDDSKPPVQKKAKVATPKVESSNDDSDSDDSLLAHIRKNSPSKKKRKKEASDSDTDDGNLLDSSSKPPPKKKDDDDDSNSDSDTDDGQDKKSGFALENSLFKNAKAVKADDGSDSDF